MKNTAMTLFAGIALAATAHAGDDYSAKGGKEVIPPPPSCLWTWFAGGSAGTVQSDWDEEIYTLHVGVERKCGNDSCTHAFFLEVGYTEKELSRSAYDPNSNPSAGNNGFHNGEVTNIPYYESYKLEMEIIPVTLNYKYECAFSDKLGWYVGAGAGVAIVNADLTHVESGDPAVDHDDSDVVFYAHIFAGLTYNVSQSFELFLGARYIFMDDPSLGDGLDFHGVEKIATIDGEVQYEIGGRFNF